jgi:hypothetical protein
MILCCNRTKAAVLNADEVRLSSDGSRHDSLVLDIGKSFMVVLLLGVLLIQPAHSRFEVPEVTPAT